VFEQFRGQLIEAAIAARPNEMCGVIYDGNLVVLENAHPEPTQYFQFSDADTLRYMSDPKTQAIVHSHPTCEPHGVTPSKMDLEQQLATNLPWVLIGFNQFSGEWLLVEWDDNLSGVPVRETSILNTPMIGREFVYGTDNCHALGRKWYWQEGEKYFGRRVFLPPLPTEAGWWERGEKLYETHYPAMGFERIAPKTPADLIPGDCFLYPFGKTDVYNHVGIYVGGGLCLEHRINALSKDYVIGPWFRRTSFWLRYNGVGGSN
jgi:proteasome lid subunit RPN8/RPN11